MEKYEQIMVVGEGSYGCVMKCRHRETGQIVAIKKFLDTEEEVTARRMAMREIRMLKKLRHENLVCLIEVFRVRKRFHLVFEFVDRTVLDELEEHDGNGLDEQLCRERIVQVIRAVRYCHLKHIIHRDVKPENVLVSRHGVVKLCDFGFARLLANTGEPCTEYVATRWYRAPELLVADVHYGPAVDVWAIGCLYSEMMTGKPLFPGDSDIDQLYRICNLLGQPCYRHQQLMQRNPNFKGLPKCSTDETSRALCKIFPRWSVMAIDFLSVSMKMDPALRATTEELIRHPYLNHDRFYEKFLPKLRQKVLQEYHDNPLIRKYQSDILAASDDRRQDMYQDRYEKKKEPPRWKINLHDPYMKRKTSYVSFSSFKSNESTTNASKGTLLQQPESQRDKKSLLSYLEQRKRGVEQTKIFKNVPTDSKENETLTTTNTTNNDRPNSDKNIELHLTAPSPPMFQSLQPETRLHTPPKDVTHRTTGIQYGVYQNVLHPTINNLSFTTKNHHGDNNIMTTKRFNNHVQTQTSLHNNKNLKESLSNNGNSLRTHLQQNFSTTFAKSPIPLTNQPTLSRNNDYIKKLSRGLVLDVSQLNNPTNLENNNTTPHHIKTPPCWLNTAGYTMYKKNHQVEQTTWTKLDPGAGGERCNEKTSFPNINGGSPFKKKKLPQFIPLSHDPVNNTPRNNSSNSQHPPQPRQNNNFSTNNNNNNLPFM